MKIKFLKSLLSLSFLPIIWFVFFVQLVFFSLFWQKAKALDLEIDILNNNHTPLPMIISDFYVTQNTQKHYERLKNTIIWDLKNTGAIAPTFVKDELVNGFTNFSEDQIDVSAYSYYQATLMGKFIYDDKNRIYILQVMLMDNYLGTAKFKNQYIIKEADIIPHLNFIAHNIANDVYKALTGLQGYFNFSLLYVENKNQLVIADYNGENRIILFKGKGEIYAPAFSNKGDYIVYVDFYQGTSELYIYDLYFKKTIKLISLGGLSLSPNFVKDDKSLIFSLAKDGSTNIYELDIASKKVKALTKSYSINLSGGYSFDKQYVIFNSNRIGRPQIYVMSIMGEKVTKVSKNTGNYFTPSFAPNSNLILFTKIEQGAFKIGIMNMAGIEKIISVAKKAENPKWLADGRHLIYQYSYSKDNFDHLYMLQVVDIVSGYKLNIKNTFNAKYPSLSKSILFNKKISIKSL
ncbi:Tol-Pal system protein TolB [Candidatus Hepatincolaceae symbiont of Richtersius coronifer]